MIEQTEMVVTTWHFHLPNIRNSLKQLTNTTTMDVMQKRNALKKGLPAGYIASLKMARPHTGLYSRTLVRDRL